MPTGESTRPTTDRVREALFSTLASWAGAASAAELGPLSFVDLFAGSGAVGLEAASRGASPVVLVEKNPKAVAVIRRNLAGTSLDAQVIAGSAESVVTQPAPRAFDVLWADPPYSLESEQLADVVTRALDHGWLASDGLVVLERSAREPAPVVASATHAWQNQYGETQLFYYRFDR